MLPERPQSETRPCPACGNAVDTLRANAVVWLDDGARFLCGAKCRERFLAGERKYDADVGRRTPTPSRPRPSIPDLVREATQVGEAGQAIDEEPVSSRRYDAVLAACLAALGAAMVAMSPAPELVWLSAFFIALCALLNARSPLTILAPDARLRQIAPTGLALAVLSSLLSADPNVQRWSLLGSALAGIVLSSRNWIHAIAWSPVRALGRQLRQQLPVRARVPSEAESAYEELDSSAVQPGDSVVVLEGENAPVDGVIEEGSGIALLYPESFHSMRYEADDFMLAGTRILKGALTLRARRTGSDRSIVRALGIGKTGRGRGGVGVRGRQLADRLAWVPIAAAAMAVALHAGGSAAAALLLGIPVLAAMSARDAPLAAGARSAARRGLFFGTTEALREAGRIDTTAILLRGALSAGEPQIQRIELLGRTTREDVLAMAAGAERASRDHPIARAIRTKAEELRVDPAPVRRDSALPGLGVTAISAQGLSVVVGRRQLLLDEGISVAGADTEAQRMESDGLTPIFVAVDRKVEALLAVRDPTHVGAPAAIRRITDLPSEVVMLSGDDRGTVEAVATQLGTTRVKAPLLARERVEEVRVLREAGVTAAIGRGGEDDDVLAAADVPVTLRLVGTESERRGIGVASRDIRDAANALWIARAVRRSMGRALGGCTAALTLVVVGSWLGWLAPPGAAVLALTIEAWTLRAGSRLLRRVDLRVPMRQ